MLNVNKVDLLNGIKQSVNIKNNKSEESAKDNSFDTYLVNSEESKLDNKDEVYVKEDYIVVDVVGDKLDSDEESDNIPSDILSVLGLYGVALKDIKDIKDNLVFTEGGKDLKGIYDSTKECSLNLNNIVIDNDIGVNLIKGEVINNSIKSSIDLKNLLNNDLDILNSIVNEEGSLSDLPLDYIEYDYFEKDNVLMSETIEPNILTDSTVLNIKDSGAVVPANTVISGYTVRQDMFVHDMLSNIDYMSKEGIQRLKLHLSPKDLGDMVVEIVRIAESSKLVITLSKEDLYNVVQNNMKELTSQLNGLNVKVSEVSVELKTDLNKGFMGQEEGNQNQESSNKNSRRSKNKKDNNYIEDIVKSRAINIIKDDRVLLCV